MITCHKWTFFIGLKLYLCIILCIHKNNHSILPVKQPSWISSISKKQVINQLKMLPSKWDNLLMSSSNSAVSGIACLTFKFVSL